MARQIGTKKVAAAKNPAISFMSELAEGELLTGTPTVTDSDGELTISDVRINTTELLINGVRVPAGMAVQWHIATGGTANKMYTLTVEAMTDATPKAQNLVDNEVRLKVE